MTANMISLLILTATIGSGIIAGVFFAFSIFIMKAFGQLPAGQAISAMQSINTTIIRTLFMVVFFRTAVCCISLIVYSAMQWGEGQAIYLAIGSVLYLVGVIFVTIAFNVPLNNSLARLNVANNLSESAWTDYAQPWTVWNHVRTALSFISSRFSHFTSRKSFALTEPCSGQIPFS